MRVLGLLQRLPYRLRRRAQKRRLGTMLFVLSLLALILTPFYVIYKPPALLIRYFQYRWPDVLWQVDNNSKLIALTIDDAPSGHTRDILELLKQHDATATFFVIGGQADGDYEQETLRELILNGNELGNHAMHDQPSRSLSDEVLRHEIRSVEAKLVQAYRAAGVDGPPQYFRPGSGFFSTRMRKLVADMDYKLILCSIYPHDPQIPYWWVNARHILSMLRSGGIVCCHDRRSWTVPMLQKVLPEARRRGYKFVTVTKLLEAGKQRLP